MAGNILLRAVDEIYKEKIVSVSFKFPLPDIIRWKVTKEYILRASIVLTLLYLRTIVEQCYQHRSSCHLKRKRKNRKGTCAFGMLSEYRDN